MMSNAIKGYTVVAWPESMPDDWALKLERLNFGYSYSTHDKDTDETGQLKKAHMHFYFQGSPTVKEKKYIHASLGVNYGENVRSAEGMYAYLTHENTPSKYHYSRDIIKHSSKWSQELFEVACSMEPDKKDHTQEIMEIIANENITEYSDLIKCIVSMGRVELLSTVKQYWVIRYIDSIRACNTKSH